MNWGSQLAFAKRTAAITFGLMTTGMMVFAEPASAQSSTQSTYPPAVESQCKDDYFRYCSPYALGSDELRRCMEAKGGSLSSHCQQALKNAGYVKSDRARRGS
jgi:hypothetical protein